MSAPRLLRKSILPLLLGLLLASVAANVLLYLQSIRAYSELLDVRLDPTAAERIEAANAQLPPPAPGRKRIVLFGDSRIEMWNPLPSAPGVQFVNRGVHSQTTAELLLRLNRDVIALKPDLVILEMGINDLKTIGVREENEQQIVNSCNRNTDLTIERLREQGIPVVYLTIFPAGKVPLVRRPVWSDKTRVATAAVNRRMIAASRPGLTVVDCDPVLADGQKVRREYALDMLHLNAAGYAALNRLIEPVLVRVMSSDSTGRK